MGQREIGVTNEPPARRGAAAAYPAILILLAAEALGFALRPAGVAVACIAMLVVAVAAGPVLHRRLEAAAKLRADASVAAVNEQAAAGQREAQRQLRHDIRGALSPALLTADRLLGNEDPKVRRAGEIMVKAVERAAALLADPATPPAGP
jgi:hypothetical protein